MRALRVAFIFLTRLPVPFAGTIGPVDLARGARLFPLVGFFVGCAVAAVFHLAALAALPPLASALLALGAGALLTGALHEDALAAWRS